MHENHPSKSAKKEPASIVRPCLEPNDEAFMEWDYEGGTTKNTNMCTRTTNGGIDLPTHHPLPLCTFLRVFFLPLGPFFPYTCLPFQQGGKH